MLEPQMVAERINMTVPIQHDALILIRTIFQITPPKMTGGILSMVMMTITMTEASMVIAHPTETIRHN